MTSIARKEGEAIAEFLGKYWGQDSAEEIADIRESMRASVVRDYMSDGPGYYGDIYFVVFGGGPEFHYVLTNYRGEGFAICEREFPPPQEEGGGSMKVELADYKPRWKVVQHWIDEQFEKETWDRNQLEEFFMEALGYLSEDDKADLFDTDLKEDGFFNQREIEVLTNDVMEGERVTVKVMEKIDPEEPRLGAEVLVEGLKEFGNDTEPTSNNRRTFLKTPKGDLYMLVIVRYPVFSLQWYTLALVVP